MESGEGEHLAWGRPGPWPAPGLRRPESSLRPAGTPAGAGLGLFPVYSAIFFLKDFTRREWERRERSLWPPSSEHK